MTHISLGFRVDENKSNQLMYKPTSGSTTLYKLGDDLWSEDAASSKLTRRYELPSKSFTSQ